MTAFNNLNQAHEKLVEIRTLPMLMPIHSAQELNALFSNLSLHIAPNYEYRVSVEGHFVHITCNADTLPAFEVKNSSVVDSLCISDRSCEIAINTSTFNKVVISCEDADSISFSRPAKRKTTPSSHRSESLSSCGESRGGLNGSLSRASG